MTEGSLTWIEIPGVARDLSTLNFELLSLNFSNAVPAMTNLPPINLSVREINSAEIKMVVDYFINSSEEFLAGMGVVRSKIPPVKDWIRKLQAECEKPYDKKEGFIMLWLIDGQPAGHSSLSHIHYGDWAKMHLHLWRSDSRKKGIGAEFVKMTIPHYFKNFKLKTLVCEPFAENPAPNKVMIKLGFRFIKTYETEPGQVNFLQKVNRYEITCNEFEQKLS